MCLGIHHIHPECRHAKKFVPIERCPLATATGCNNLTTLHILNITAPRLCVPCFRRKEAKMDSDYETLKESLQSEIARVDRHLASGGAGIEHAAASLRNYRAECEDDIVQAKAARDLKIRLFRQRQGVWGDG